MKIIEYVDYDANEILSLYESVGWSAYTQNPDSLKLALANSLLTLAAYQDEQLVGLIRVVGDGVTTVLIQDILIKPSHQRQGIGRALMNEILARYSNVRQLQLFTDNTDKTKSFYQSLGFVEVSTYGVVAFARYV